MKNDSQDQLTGDQLARLIALAASEDEADLAAIRDATTVKLPDEECPPESAPSDNELDIEPGPFQPGDVIDGFKILEEVGRGGMCIVYKARQESPERPVALKVLRPSLAQDPAIAKRFHRESVIVANLTHPNILPIFSYAHNPPELPYFTMEFVRGRSVREEVGANGRLEPSRAVRIALEAAKALHHAHENDIIHRDVTPRNLLLQGPEQYLRVSDFGIAKDITGQLAETTQAGGSSFGTPAFMAPEQNLCQEVDRRTDIYSLGSTLYYMLTGEVPYEAGNPAELALAFQSKRPQSPGKLNPSVSAELNRIVMKMIEVNPDRRYRTCADVACDLEGYVRATEGGSTAPAPVAVGRTRKAAPITLAVMAILALALVLWSVFSPGGTGMTTTGDQSPTDRGNSTNAQARGSLTPQTGGGDGTDNTAAARIDKATEAGRNPTPTSKPRVFVPPTTRPVPKKRDSVTVEWVYQPDPKKTFADPGTIAGQAVLKDDDPLSMGMYIFERATGLAPYESPELKPIDFRVSVKDGAVTIIRDAPDQAAGCIMRTVGGDFRLKDLEAPPAQGYKTSYEYELKKGMILLFRCTVGGYAKMMLPAPREQRPNLLKGVAK